MKQPLILTILAIFGISTISSAKELSFGLVANTSSPEYFAAKKLADTAKELSDGALTIKLYPDGQLGNFQELLDQTSLGELDMAYIDSQGISIFEKSAEPLGQAYVIKSHEHAIAIYNSPWGEALKQKLKEKNNWHFLNINYQGTRHTTSNKPLNSIEDFAGLRLRVPGAKPMLNFAKAVGASATPIAFAEVYLALQTGSADGQENPLTLIDAKKFYEVQDYLALTGHMVQDQITLVNNDVWESLSAKEQEILYQASEEARKLQYDLVTKGENELIDFFKEQGMQITTPDVEQFVKAMEPVWKEYDLETINMLRAIEQ